MGSYQRAQGRCRRSRHPLAPPHRPQTRRRPLNAGPHPQPAAHVHQLFANCPSGPRVPGQGEEWPANRREGVRGAHTHTHPHDGEWSAGTAPTYHCRRRIRHRSARRGSGERDSKGGGDWRVCRGRLCPARRGCGVAPATTFVKQIIVVVGGYQLHRTRKRVGEPAGHGRQQRTAQNCER